MVDDLRRPLPALDRAEPRPRLGVGCGVVDVWSPAACPQIREVDGSGRGAQPGLVGGVRTFLLVLETAAVAAEHAGHGVVHEAVHEALQPYAWDVAGSFGDVSSNRSRRPARSSIVTC